MRERRRDGPEDEQERAREEAAEPARLDERRREQDGERLGEDVEAAHVGELVRDDRLELLAADDPQQAGRDGERGAAGPATDDEGPREAVVDQAELRRRDASWAATRSVAERRSGSSASANGRAPSMPSSARSPSQ